MKLNEMKNIMQVNIDYVDNREDEFIGIAKKEGITKAEDLVKGLAFWLDSYEHRIVVNRNKYHIYDIRGDEFLQVNVGFKDVIYHASRIVRIRKECCEDMCIQNDREEYIGFLDYCMKMFNDEGGKLAC